MILTNGDLVELAFERGCLVHTMGHAFCLERLQVNDMQRLLVQKVQYQDVDRCVVHHPLYRHAQGGVPEVLHSVNYTCIRWGCLGHRVQGLFAQNLQARPGPPPPSEFCRARRAQQNALGGGGPGRAHKY